MTSWLWVAVGGALGALMRHAVVLGFGPNLLKAFPFATLLVNIVGSFCLGLLMAVHQQQIIAEHWRLLLGVGLLGAFTTFSTFSVEVVTLMQAGAWGKALLHAGLNFFCCLVAVLLAFWLVPTAVK